MRWVVDLNRIYTTMSKIELTESEKNSLFIASFLSLAAAGFGFVFRVLSLGSWKEEFGFTGQQLGELFGASLWPIAITMVVFSLIIDKTGYKWPMVIGAGLLQVLSVIITFTAKDYTTLYIGGLLAGLAHGVVEAVINPVCAAVYRDQKSKMLNILHAAWPAGLVFGGAAILLTSGASWQIHALYMAVPAIIHGVLFLRLKRYPEDERVTAKVSYKQMLAEFGGLGVMLVAFFFYYEIARLLGQSGAALISGAAICAIIFGAGFGFWVKSAGKIMIFIVSLLMIPLATAELGTDAWIKELLTPSLGADKAGWAIVVSALIMMVLRFRAGDFLKIFTPPALLVFSGVFSATGLMLLSNPSVAGWAVWAAFVVYAVGQTFYWPTVLGFISEQFPKGGAMTLNSVSAIGLISVGILGGPFLGMVQDSKVANTVAKEAPAIYEVVKDKGNFFGYKNPKVDQAKTVELAEASGQGEKIKTAVDNSRRGALFTAGFLPLALALGYFIIALYYRSKGGYKPVDILADSKD